MVSEQTTPEVAFSHLTFSLYDSDMITSTKKNKGYLQMKKQIASKRVMVVILSGVMGFSCLVGCGGAKKEQPVTSIQSQ